MCDHAHYILYNRVFKNISLYGIIIIGKNVTGRKRAQYVPDVHVLGGGGGEGAGRGATCAIAPLPPTFSEGRQARY